MPSSLLTNVLYEQPERRRLPPISSATTSIESPNLSNPNPTAFDSGFAIRDSGICFMATDYQPSAAATAAAAAAAKPAEAAAESAAAAAAKPAAAAERSDAAVPAAPPAPPQPPQAPPSPRPAERAQHDEER